MARPNLLAVDDDVSVLEAVVQDLRRQYGSEYRVMRAASGQAALDTLNQLKTRQEPVALLLSDQRMPGMTGVEFLERAREFYPHAKRVLLTGDLFLKAFPNLYLGSARGEALPGSE